MAKIPILEERKHVIPWILLGFHPRKVNITMENGQISVEDLEHFLYILSWWEHFPASYVFFGSTGVFHLKDSKPCFQKGDLFTVFLLEFLSEFWMEIFKLLSNHGNSSSILHTDIYEYVYIFHVLQKSRMNQSCVWHH